MDRGSLEELRAVYRDGLLEDTLPFWIPRSVDREHGGFSFCLDRDGTLYETDKGMWQQGRFTWLLGTLHATVEPRDEWFELCRHGIDFLRAHGFDDDGRMWFRVTREGRPLHKRRYVFTEAFAAQAFGAWARISGDERARDEALATWELMRRCMTTPGALEPKFTGERPLKSIGTPMIRIGVAQALREMEDDPRFTAEIDECIAEIERDFVDDERGVVLESVAPDGSVVDHLEGRTLNPGHAIEAAWFVLEEALRRGGDRALTDLGARMVDHAWRRGWDTEYGGFLYFTDLLGKPVQEYWHDMKFWWPQTEAILGTLLAWQATGEERFARRHRRIHDWAYEHFPDPEHGEWFGYLHRDGRLSSTAKGNLWKGPFHLPRMQWRAWRACDELLELHS